MYIENDNFEIWMEKLSTKLNSLSRDFKCLLNSNNIFDKDEKLLDNQDLAFMLKLSYRTLQRHRSNGVLPYFLIGKKIYYRTLDIRTFIKVHCDSKTVKKFEQEAQIDN